jgi:ABC-2 type transport system permease protein
MLALGAVLSAAYVVLACWFFARIYRYAVHTGLLARYSAESVS